MSLLGSISRKVSPKEVINYFRRTLIGSGELGRKEINQIKGKLKNLSQEDKERLRTADLEDLTPEEVDLVMFGFVGFKDFGMPNKTIVQMKGNEFSQFKKKINKIVDDVIGGKTESVEEFTLEDGKIRSNMVEKKKEIPTGDATQLTLFNEGGVISSLLSDERIKFSKGSSFALKALKDILGEAFEFGARIKPLTKSQAKQKVSTFLKASKELKKLQDQAYEQGLIAEAEGNRALVSKYSDLFGKIDDQLGEIDLERLRLEEFIKTGRRPKFNEGGETSMLKPDYIDIDGDGNKTEPMKEAAKDAKERDGMALGGLSKLLLRTLISKYNISIPKGKKPTIQDAKDRLKTLKQNLKELKDETPDNSRMDEIDILEGEIGDLEADIIKVETGVADDLSVRGMMAEGGEMDEQMSKLMEKEQQPPMESDEEMEENYLDFIIDEALTEEEEDMLMSKLEQDEQLSMLFDKVVEVASEFAGSGPVEGPGTGVSDSIPARLSDGEFVFTAKAVEEIGADNLMAMMKDAEMMADQRQGMANGGEMEEETVKVESTEPATPTQVINVRKETVGSQASVREEEDLVKDSITRRMMAGRSSPVS